MKIEITEEEKEILISTIRSWEYSSHDTWIRKLQISLLKKLGADPNDIYTHDDKMKELYPLSYKVNK